MPNYNNYQAYPAYSAYPANGYQQQYSQGGYMQQPMQSYQQPQTQAQGICWVDGEIGAKAQALPAGWPAMFSSNPSAPSTRTVISWK